MNLAETTVTGHYVGVIADAVASLASRKQAQESVLAKKRKLN